MLRAAIVAMAICISAGVAPIFAQDTASPMTPITFRPDPARPDPSGSAVVTVAGAECPSGSGSYCSDELPYCCPGVNTAAYCAADVNGCTK